MTTDAELRVMQLEGLKWLVRKFDLQAVYLARKLAESNPDGPSEFDLIVEAHNHAKDMMAGDSQREAHDGS